MFLLRREEEEEEQELNGARRGFIYCRGVECSESS